MGHSSFDQVERPAWNMGRKLGAKRPLKPKEIWAIRFLLDQDHRIRDRALFDLAIDSKLRGCDLVRIRIGDLVAGGRIRNRAMVIQQKTKRPVQFELLEPARTSFLRGSSAEKARSKTLPYRAALIAQLTSARDSMRGWSTSGLAASDSGERIMERTHCAELRPR